MGRKRTLQHVMYECPRSKKYRLSQAAESFRGRFPHQCFWLRGMVPSGWTRLAYKAEKCQVEKTGIFLEGEQDVSCLVVGTDASGGPYTKDPRLRAVGWAVVIGRRQGHQVEVLGTISGVLMPPATVPQGEHAAIIEALKRTNGDLATDCKGALKTLTSRVPHKSSMPEWGEVWHHRAKVQATWVRAHKEEADFAKEFPQQERRRQLNIAADQLAGQRAKAALSLRAARKVQEVDRIATEVNDYLALRAEEQLQSADNEFVPKSVRDTMSQFSKKAQKPRAKAPLCKQEGQVKANGTGVYHGT